MGLKERIEGRHAVVIVGFDDKMKVLNEYGKVETTGALSLEIPGGKNGVIRDMGGCLTTIF